MSMSSYQQMMKWNRKHPRGIKLNIIMSTDSGFWPSVAYLEEDYLPYKEDCKKRGITPLSCEEYYKTLL